MIGGGGGLPWADRCREGSSAVIGGGGSLPWADRCREGSKEREREQNGQGVASGVAGGGWLGTVGRWDCRE